VIKVNANIRIFLEKHVGGPVCIEMKVKKTPHGIVSNGVYHGWGRGVEIDSYCTCGCGRAKEDETFYNSEDDSADHTITISPANFIYNDGKLLWKYKIRCNKNVVYFDFTPYIRKVKARIKVGSYFSKRNYIVSAHVYADGDRDLASPTSDVKCRCRIRYIEYITGYYSNAYEKTIIADLDVSNRKVFHKGKEITGFENLDKVFDSLELEPAAA
jgi:hypothetical protein